MRNRDSSGGIGIVLGTLSHTRFEGLDSTFTFCPKRGLQIVPVFLRIQPSPLSGPSFAIVTQGHSSLERVYCQSTLTMHVGKASVAITLATLKTKFSAHLVTAGYAGRHVVGFVAFSLPPAMALFETRNTKGTVAVHTVLCWWSCIARLTSNHKLFVGMCQLYRETTIQMPKERRFGPERGFGSPIKPIGFVELQIDEFSVHFLGGSESFLSPQCT